MALGIKRKYGFKRLSYSRDRCEICHGVNGGARGNELIVYANKLNGTTEMILVCDHCYSEHFS